MTSDEINARLRAIADAANTMVESRDDVAILAAHLQATHALLDLANHGRSTRGDEHRVATLRLTCGRSFTVRKDEPVHMWSDWDRTADSKKVPPGTPDPRD